MNPQISEEAREAAALLWKYDDTYRGTIEIVIQELIDQSTAKLTEENETLKLQIKIDDEAFHGKRNQIAELEDTISKLTEDNKRLMELVERISKQKPEKPDYWSSCGQCERNIDDAQELRSEIAKLKGEG